MADLRQAMVEVEEQPALLRELWETRDAWAHGLAGLCHERTFSRLLFVGNGSPYYAGQTLRFAAERLLGVNADSVPAAVFHNHGGFDASGRLDPREVLLVCPAETGHSKGQVDAARRARELGVATVCTTLNPTGVLARECDVVLPKPGAPERSIAATKNQTMALFLVLTSMVEAAHDMGRINGFEYDVLTSALAAVPDNVEATIADSRAWFEANADRLMTAPQFFLIGYGPNYGTVQEGALKFYETHERPTYAFELEECLHGPFRALHADDMCVFLSAEAGPERDRMGLMARAIEPYCRNRVVVQSVLQDRADDPLVIHSGDVEFVSTLEYLIPLQVIAVLMAERLGIDLTQPKVAALDDIMEPAYTD